MDVPLDVVDAVVLLVPLAFDAGPAGVVGPVALRGGPVALRAGAVALWAGAVAGTGHI